MAHLIPLSEPPQLAVQRGITSIGLPFGYEAYFSIVDAEEEGRRIARMQQAVGTLATATDQNSRDVRRLVDRRYAEDTAGAPPDFPFRREPGESIVELLVGVDAATFTEFCKWNIGRLDQLEEAVQLTRPQLREQVGQWVGRLIQRGIFPNNAARSFDHATRFARLKAVDSFDGALIDGATTSSGEVGLTHMFDSGYDIGAPTKHYFTTGQHEFAHAVRVRHGTNMRGVPLLEEVLIEQCVLAGAEDAPPRPLGDFATSPTRTPYRAAQKLFAIALNTGVAHVGLYDLAYLLADREPTALDYVKTRLADGFNDIFPEHSGNAWQLFKEGLAQTHPVAREAYADTWAQQAVARTGIDP